MSDFTLHPDDKAQLRQARCLYTMEDIDAALNNLAKQLNQRLGEEHILVLNILQGGTLTTGMLLPKLQCLLNLDSVYASRYRNQTQGHKLEWKQYPTQELQGQIVLLVDDIYDEGITLAAVKEYCLEQGAREVITLVLLNKQHKRKLDGFKPDYIALDVADHYVFGFGLDYHGRYRNAPGIYALPSKQ